MRLSISVALLSFAITSPVLACGSCVMDAGTLHIPFLLVWFQLSCLWFLGAVGIRIYTKTFTFIRVLAAIGWMLLGFVAAALTGPLPLALFLLGWFVKYISHMRDKNQKDPASQALAKLGHLFLGGLILTAVVGVAYDKISGPEGKLSRGVGGTNTRAYCLKLGKAKTIPAETLVQLAQSKEDRLRWNALAVLAYSQDAEGIPLLVEAINEPRGEKPYWLNDILLKSLQDQSGQDIYQPKEWSKWLKDPDGYVAPATD